MNGFDRLRNQVKDQEDMALKETVDYLLTRKDMEQKYLNEEKTLEEMAKFIRNKGNAHCRNGWNYITNEVVFAWAIMYFSLPNSFLKINTNKSTKKEKSTSQNSKTKNNIISLEEAKKEIDKKQEVVQISLFGGEVQ